MKSIFTIAFAVLAMAFTGSVEAQGFGGFGGSSFGGFDSFGGSSFGGGFGGSSFGGGFDSFGGAPFSPVGSFGKRLVGPGGPNDCGRNYTNQQAASLWGGYCNESCVSSGGGGFFGKKCGGGCRLKHSRSAFGYPSSGCGGGGGGCGCSQGCFGYPSSCGGGCGGGGCSTGGRHRGGCKIGGLLSRLLGKFHRGGAGSCHRCSLGGFRLFGHHRGGGGLCKKRRARKTSYAAITTYPVTTVAVDQCGCGSSGQYFDYAVGAEYGTAGIQSSVSGELTGACSSCGDSGGYDMGVPMSYESPDFSGAPMIEQGMDLLPSF